MLGCTKHPAGQWEISENKMEMVPVHEELLFRGGGQTTRVINDVAVQGAMRIDVKTI